MRGIPADDSWLLPERSEEKISISEAGLDCSVVQQRNQHS
jgi:hypothetical protein